MFKTKNKKIEQRIKRHKKVRSKVRGTALIPRMSVFRGNAHIYVQLIDDIKGHTIVSTSDLLLKNKKGNKVEQAREVGKMIAHMGKEHKLTKAVFDRGGYKYHGRVRAVAEGAREGGLIF